MLKFIGECDSSDVFIMYDGGGDPAMKTKKESYHIRKMKQKNNRCPPSMEKMKLAFIWEGELKRFSGL